MSLAYRNRYKMRIHVAADIAQIMEIIRKLEAAHINLSSFMRCKFFYVYIYSCMQKEGLSDLGKLLI